MFRRRLCCIHSEIFPLGSKALADGDEVVVLSRKAAEELVWAGIFSLVAIRDISVRYDAEIYATDASSIHGAFTALDVGEDLASVFWLGGDRKGAYYMLDQLACQMLRALGEADDEAPLWGQDLPTAPPKMLDFRFDVVEVCGGSRVLSDAMSKHGLKVCTPIDLSKSLHFKLEEFKLVEWIFQMIFEGRFRGVVV